MLKKIEAYIRHEKLDSVRMALIEIGVPAIDTVEVQGHGRQSGIKLAGRHATYIVDTLPRIQVNLVVGDEQLDEVVEAIRSNAVTGTQGDGASFISPVENLIRISTGEEGDQALTYEGDIDIEEHQVSRD